jgi:hypothetical protein
MEMEEDLILSDEELNKALQKLHEDVNVEKERADENFEQLLLQKRHVMQVDKKMKDMQITHNEHVELIDKLKSENAELKKTVMELDYEKRILKKVVTLTDEKTQHLVHERKEQETKTIVRDFKIQQVSTLLPAHFVCHLRGNPSKYVQWPRWPLWDPLEVVFSDRELQALSLSEVSELNVLADKSRLFP